MTFYDRFAERARAASLVSEQTSYFSEPEPTLDPRLFTAGSVLNARIRTALLSVLYGFWRTRYRDPEAWSTCYLAGSGVSYQWSAARNPGDLDCLITVDWVQFRRLNDDYIDLGDKELQSLLNQEMFDHLWPTTTNWFGYELTTYINQGTIQSIKPYAAYDVTHDRWVVRPDPHAHAPMDPAWEHLAQGDLDTANMIVDSYNKAYREVEGTVNPGMRLNAEITLRTTAMRGAMFFDDIHEGRKKAFSPEGAGYQDFHEYRYKAAKGNGIIAALKEMKQELADADLVDQQGTYGTEVLDAHRALLRSAMERRFQR